MSAFRSLARAEAVGVLREPTGVALVVLLPLGLLLGLGLLLDLADPLSTADRESAAFVPALAVALLLGLVALVSLPATLALYRDSGVLRRLSTTPAAPGALLGAHLAVHLVLVVAATAALAVAALTVVGLPVPASPGTAVLVTALSALALFAAGLVVAALAPSARAGAALGPVLLVPVLFLSGAWVPLEVLPGWLEVVARHSPLGALVDGLLRAWAGVPVAASQLIAPAATAAVLSAVAVRTFRWE
ncbi:ABC transporter permease [Kineococcus sp. SYSU DK004]|uniref:ABC transporter permease n=1 Tax=Kineococcus sp. SYSU DK004 TaxID=3383125 RepID=UPI003D7D016D